MQEQTELKNKIDRYKQLFETIEQGNLKVVESLLNEGASVNAVNEKGLFPLHVAAEHNRADIAELLIRKNANVGVPSREKNFRIPLCCAAEKGNLETAQVLLKNGAEVDGKQKDGWTPLHVAVLNGHLKVIELLLEHGADIELLQGEVPPIFTPFIHVSPITRNLDRDKEVEVIKLLLQWGANPNSKHRNESIVEATGARGRTEIGNLIQNYELIRLGGLKRAKKLECQLKSLQQDQEQLQQRLLQFEEKVGQLESLSQQGQSRQSKWKTPSFQSFNNTGVAAAFAVVGFSILYIELDEDYRRQLQIAGVLLIALSLGILMNNAAHSFKQFGNFSWEFFNNKLGPGLKAHGLTLVQARADVHPNAMNVQANATGTVHKEAVYAPVLPGAVSDNGKICRIM